MPFTTALPRRGSRVAPSITSRKCSSASVTQACRRNTRSELQRGGDPHLPPPFSEVRKWGRCHVVTEGAGTGNISPIVIVLRAILSYIDEGVEAMKRPLIIVFSVV